MLCFALLLLCSPLKAQLDMTINNLAHNFVTPMTEYGAYVWWHWMGSNFSREGITKELEAMKEAGIGGATIALYRRVDCRKFVPSTIICAENRTQKFPN